ncbi:MAG: phosphate acyltransferase, partial [Lachnospiraceae bacterium]|nr:phosphate acyltransferase [Lachnospiraceae bacterium]
MIKVAVDAMGGDNAPGCNVKGAILALQENKDIEIILIGKEELIQPILSQEKADMARIHVVNAREVIETGDEPAISVLKKKDSSLVLGMKMLKNGEADAFVSAGSSGAILVGGQIIAGYVGGVRRAPLAVEIPTVKGTSL